LDPTAFKHLDEPELLMAQNAIRSKIMIIQKALRKKNYTAKESAGKSKSQTELSELADMCNYQAKNSNEQEAINELNLNQESAYCSFNSNSLEFAEFWQKNSAKLPLLTAFVRRYSLIPAASVPSEAAFSIANFIQRKERSVMSSKMLRISMIMKECLEPLHSDYLNETK
jgi:hypothetical protein